MKRRAILFLIILLGTQSLLSQGLSRKAIKLRQEIFMTTSKYYNLDYGYAIIHIQNQDTILFNNNDFPMASMNSLPIAVSIMDRVDRDRASLDRVVDKNSGKTLDMLMGEMLKEESGDALSSILDRVISPRKVGRYLKKNGFSDIRLKHRPRDINNKPDLGYINSSTPLAMANLMASTAYSDILKERSREYIRELISRNGVKDIPDKVGVYALGGVGSINSFGVVQAYNKTTLIEIDNENHIVVSVFIQNAKLKDKVLEDIISNIITLTYKAYSNE